MSEKAAKTFKFGLLIFGIIAFFAFIFMRSQDSDENVSSSADGFYISYYDVILDVSDDGKVDVTENIGVYFTNQYKHGIYKFTPYWYQYTGKDGKTIKRKSNIEDLRCTTDPYMLDTVKNKARIKIGSANSYVNEGLKEYEIKYTYDMGKDPFKGFDEFIFHAFGDYWGTEINNASITVNMPKSIEEDKINFFTDKFRKQNVNDYVSVVTNGNSLIAKYNGMDAPHLSSSLTVDIELPEGYFVNGSDNYGGGSLLCIIITFVLTIVSFFTWRKYGKDYDKGVETVEFYPPDNLSAAEIGYVYNNKSYNKKLTIALIISLASKGYIKIDEEEKSKDISITNLVAKPRPISQEEKSMPKRIIEIEKLKSTNEYQNDETLSKSEKTMMEYLFKGFAGTRKLDVNIDKFLLAKENLINKGYIKIISDNEKEIEVEAKDKKATLEKLKKQYEKDLEKYNDKLMSLPQLTDPEQIVYDILFTSSDCIKIKEHTTLYSSFDEIKTYLDNSFVNQIHDQEGEKKIPGCFKRAIVAMILSIIAYRYLEDLNPVLYGLYYASFGCIVVNIIFAYIMARKTTYGEELKARVAGFRNFLEVAEKEQLEALVEKDPKYFYNILPYTYVLGISRTWVQKFENIPMPEFDFGTFNYSDYSSFDHINDDIYIPRPSYYSGGGSSCSSCSSCGGGCSSCGGGCSSCGGGGSW